MLTEADAAGTRAAFTATAETFGVSANRRDLALFFHQHFVKAADGFFQFTAEALCAFRVRFTRELSDAASTAGTQRTAAGAFTARFSTVGTGTAAFAAGRRFGIAVGTAATAAETFSGLAHAADATGQHTGVATITLAVAVSIGVTVGIAFSRLAVTAFAGTAASRHRETVR